MMVVSRKGKRPHLVTKGKAGKFSCDSECANWKSLGLCSHVVAVAHTNGQLEEFCNSYRKLKKLPNISKLLLTGLPGGVGNKGNRVTRKRKKIEISSRIPLSSSSAGSSVSLDSSPGTSSPSLESSNDATGLPPACPTLQPPLQRFPCASQNICQFCCTTEYMPCTCLQAHLMH